MRYTKRFSTLVLTAACLLGAASLAMAEDAPQAAPTGAISGKVVDKDGVAVEGAKVTASVPPPPGEKTKWIGYATTDKDGAFKVTGLVDGTYNVVVKKDFSRGEKFAVEVADGKETVLKDSITMNPARVGG